MKNKGYTLGQLLEALWGKVDLNAKVRIEALVYIASLEGFFMRDEPIRELRWPGSGKVDMRCRSERGKAYRSLKALLFDLMENTLLQKDQKVLVDGRIMAGYTYNPSSNVIVFQGVEPKGS